ncbi:MAG: hypothetical protein ABI999_06590 [Acidobacteriota bacterium]
MLILSATIWMTGCNGRIGPSLRDPNTGPGGGGSGKAPAERRLDIGSPLEIKYAGVEFKVTRAVITEAEDSSGAQADITLSVVNPLEVDTRIAEGQWQLRLGGGPAYTQPFYLQISARETKEVNVNFAVPENATWSGGQLSLDEKGKEPAAISLDRVPEKTDAYPVRLASGGMAVTKDPAMTFTIKEATLDLDGIGTRAAVGKRYLNLTVSVNEHDPGPGEFLPEFFRLLVNGEPASPENTGEKTTVEAQSTQDYTMSFLIPQDAADIALEVGKPDVQKTAKIPIDMRSK